MAVEFSRWKIAAPVNSPELELVLTREKPRLLLVHGANCSAAVWRRLMEALWEQGISSAALDLRGHGHSQGRDELQRWRIEDYIEDVLRCFGILSNPPVVVGHSMGGLVAQLVAARAPLAGLGLLASSPVKGMQRDGWRMFFRHPLQFLGSRQLKSFAYLYRDSATCRSLLFSRHTPEALITEFMSSLQEESWQAANQMVSLLPTPERVSCPVIVIGGSEDFMVSPQSIQQTAEAYKTEPVFVAKTGHMIQIESDASELARLLGLFLAQRAAILSHGNERTARHHPLSGFSN